MTHTASQDSASANGASHGIHPLLQRTARIHLRRMIWEPRGSVRCPFLFPNEESAVREKVRPVQENHDVSQLTEACLAMVRISSANWDSTDAYPGAQWPCRLPDLPGYLVQRLLTGHSTRPKAFLLQGGNRSVTYLEWMSPADRHMIGIKGLEQVPLEYFGALVERNGRWSLVSSSSGGLRNYQ
jgi:hypothetical protein